MTTFDGTRFLTFANELSRSVWGQLDEAAARSAVSRAYYAVFHAARERLRSDSSPIGNGHDAHRQVIDAFKLNADRERKSIGVRLEGLRKRRNSADYDDASGFSWQEAREEMNLADDLLREIRALPGAG